MIENNSANRIAMDSSLQCLVNTSRKDESCLSAKLGFPINLVVVQKPARYNCHDNYIYILSSTLDTSSPKIDYSLTFPRDAFYYCAIV